MCFALQLAVLEGLNIVRKERGINVYGYAHQDMAPVDMNLGQNKRALPEHMVVPFLACDFRQGGKMERATDMNSFRRSHRYRSHLLSLIKFNTLGSEK